MESGEDHVKDVRLTEQEWGKKIIRKIKKRVCLSKSCIQAHYSGTDELRLAWGQACGRRSVARRPDR